MEFGRVASKSIGVFGYDHVNVSLRSGRELDESREPRSIESCSADRAVDEDQIVANGSTTRFDVLAALPNLVLDARVALPFGAEPRVDGDDQPFKFATAHARIASSVAGRPNP